MKRMQTTYFKVNLTFTRYNSFRTCTGGEDITEYRYSFCINGMFINYDCMHVVHFIGTFFSFFINKVHLMKDKREMNVL